MDFDEIIASTNDIIRFTEYWTKYIINFNK